MKKTIPSGVNSNQAAALGTFELTGNDLMVSDPCYDMGTWCQQPLCNVKQGTWHAFVRMTDEGNWGVRAAELIAIHADALPGPVDAKALRMYACDSDFDWRAVTTIIGVDSGQAGFFDAAHFKEDKDAEGYKPLNPDNRICETEPWYSMCCDVTLNSPQGAGVIPHGAVSSSGYGDGSYPLRIARKAKYVVAVRLLFIGDENDET